MSLVLVKHSLPAIDPAQPPAAWALSDEGHQRASRFGAVLASRLKGQPAALYCSREPKARQTAELMGPELGIAPQVAAGLHEHLRPAPITRDTAQFEANVRQLFAQPARLVFGAETADAAHQRFAAAVQGLLAAHPTGSLVIVAHGTVISLFVARLLQRDPFALWRQLSLPSAVILARPGLELVEILL